MNFFDEIKHLFTPKKLWLLRLYLALLTYIVDFFLIFYIVLSFYNIVTSENILGNLFLGFAGFYIVSVCIGILFIIQVVSMFLNIHDNIEDIREKTMNPSYSVDIGAEKEKNKESSLRSVITIVSIILSIILSLANINKQEAGVEEVEMERQSLLEQDKIKETPPAPPQEDTELLPLLLAGDFTDQKRREISNYSRIVKKKIDLTGDGTPDKIEIFAEPDFFSPDDFEYERTYNSLIVINNKHYFSLNLFVPDSPGSNGENYACQVQIIDLDKSDAKRELFLELGQENETPLVVSYVLRFNENFFTLTSLNYIPFEGDYYRSGVNDRDNLILEYVQIVDYSSIYTDDNGTAYSTLRDFFVKYNLHSIGLKIESIDSSALYYDHLAACPYVYILKGQNYVFKGEIIRNLIGKDAETNQTMELGAFKKGKHQIRIWEKKDEVSYINQLYFTAENKTIPFKVAQPGVLQSILSDDNQYHVIKQHDYFDISIALPRDVSNLIIHAKGYYIPNRSPL
jgi:hypothetical protein